VSKAGETEDRIYEDVCKNPGKCTYEISKGLNMSGGKVRHALSSLEQKGLVMFKFVRQSPRIKKLTFPVNDFKLMPKSLKILLKNFKTFIRSV
jgi:predicted transcriptional regulator